MERIRTRGGWPKLKAKGAATRHLAGFALQLAIRFNSGSVHDRRRVGVAQLLVEFYKILESEEQFLSESARARIQVLGRDFSVLYCQLSSAAYGGGQRLWRFSPNHQLFLHLCEWQALGAGNPRFY